MIQLNKGDPVATEKVDSAELVLGLFDGNRGQTIDGQPTISVVNYGSDGQHIVCKAVTAEKWSLTFDTWCWAEGVRKSFGWPSMAYDS